MELISKDIILCSLLPCFTVDAIDILNMNKVILINLIIKSCFHNVPKVYLTDTEKSWYFGMTICSKGEIITLKAIKN